MRRRPAASIRCKAKMLVLPEKYLCRIFTCNVHMMVLLLYHA